ncbi:hypothetical protein CAUPRSCDRAFT_11674 [Caulochytrium protostelioides]|uniref:Uncharacterized protein n=1 Tax=Caulochytrium protostelioides TaxID=1555241 RepID=A0A4P9WWR7_9FUNG|nr:hypothetical protein CAUPRSCDRAFT_11674 [Caulochytrium protostelioides]
MTPYHFSLHTTCPVHTKLADAESVNVDSTDDTSDTSDVSTDDTSDVSTDDTSVDSVPAKRRRPGRAEKLKERNNQTETVVKAALLKYLQSKDKRLFRDAIHASVEAFSYRYYIASIALFSVLKRCLNGVEDLMAAELPDLTKLSSYQQLMLGVASARTPDPYVRDYYRAYPLLAARLPTQRHPGDSNMDTFGATKYKTNLSHHFQLSFEITKYVRVFQAASGPTDPQFV